MNKGVTIVLIILLSIVTICLTGLFILLMKGNFNFNFKGFFNIGYSEKLVDSKEFDTIEDIEVNSDIADVIIEQGQEGKILVELYSEDSDNYYIKNENDKISVSLKAKKKNVNFLRKQDRVVIKLPKDYDQKVKIKTNVGDTKADAFDNIKFDIEATTGDIKLDSADTLDFKITTGDVKLDKVNYISGSSTTGDIKIGEAEEFSAGTTTGDIEIEKVTKRIYAKTSTGDVKAKTITLSEDSTIKTGTGDVKIDRLEGAYIEAHTNTGDIRVNNNDRHEEKTVNISTSTGDIRVN